MNRAQPLSLPCIVLSLALAAAPVLAQRVVPAANFRIDPLLARPYSGDVPFGSTGRRLWATAPQGWAFADQVQYLYITNLHAFDVQVKTGGHNIRPTAAVSYPSHVHLSGDSSGSGEAEGSASFTFSTDNTQAPLEPPFDPSRRWTCWSSGHRSDWYQASFPAARTVSGLALYFFDDQPVGGCEIPASYQVQYRRLGAWQDVQQPRYSGTLAGSHSRSAPGSPRPPALVHFSPVRTDAIRVVFQNASRDHYTGLYGFVAQPVIHPAAWQSPVVVTGDKFISPDDVLVSALKLTNRSSRPQVVEIELNAPWMEQFTGTGAVGSAVLNKIPAFYCLQVSGGLREAWSHRGAAGFVAALPPHSSRSFTAAMAIDLTAALSRRHAEGLLHESEPVTTQARGYQAWFDHNIAAFDCPDPRVRKMVYHRWYVLKKNAMDPGFGHLNHKAFAEGRWTSDWYANVISYGAGHVAREARWLRDSSYAEGLITTWALNERPDGIFPSHITPEGQAGGQYTDWITGTAWDVYCVHPDRPFIAPIADNLARNVDGWKKVYGWNHDYLLVVDSHWWTGMEWQPSFFYFNGFHTEHDTPLRRVDLAAYNFGNADSISRIYGVLGNTARSAFYRQFANATRDAVLKRMWNAKDTYFYSLNAATDAPALVKEVVGVYPFAFGLVPPDSPYQAAWRHLLDPKEFWTPWPVASASEQCPAYSQTGWPIGPGGSICMWNGPTWPHANSMVMRAMAKTLRSGPSPVTPSALYALFHSFTLAQYRNGDFRFPWTGEYYNGDTGEWKTTQRDYNHSTYNDILIEDLIGIQPRPDSTLEIHPLLPPKTWSYFALDGQAYHGHTVSIVWQDPARRPHYRGIPTGFCVYVDGRLRLRQPTMAPVTLPLT